MKVLIDTLTLSAELTRAELRLADAEAAVAKAKHWLAYVRERNAKLMGAPVAESVSRTMPQREPHHTRLMLVSYPPDIKFNVIKAVRELTNPDLKAAKDLVESVTPGRPACLNSGATVWNIPLDNCMIAASKLHELGAVIEWE